MNTREAEDLTLYRRLVQVVGALAFGLVLVMTVQGIPAQDGSTYMVAGELARAGAWEAIYPSFEEGSPETHPRYTELYCEHMEGATRPCHEIVVPFLSPAPMLLITVPLSMLPGGMGILVLRLLSALALAWGWLRLWTEVTRQAPALGRPLAVGILLAFPLAWNGLETGQTSAWLFAGVVAGCVGVRKAGDALRLGVILTGCVIAKLSPVLFIAVLVAHRRWLAAGVATVGVSASMFAAMVMFPQGLWGTQAAVTRNFSTWITEYHNNISLDAAARHLATTALGDAALLSWVGPAKVLALLALALVLGLYVRRFSSLWALAWIVWLVVIPVNWWHYNWATIGAVVWLVAPRVRRESQGWALAAWMGLTTPILGLITQTHPLSVPLGAAWLVSSLGICLATRPWELEPES